jgi:hypothetical protein
MGAWHPQHETFKNHIKQPGTKVKLYQASLQTPIAIEPRKLHSCLLLIGESYYVFWNRQIQTRRDTCAPYLIKFRFEMIRYAKLSPVFSKACYRGLLSGFLTSGRLVCLF